MESGKRRRLAKRKTELANMQDRLLNAYLAETITEEVMTAKTAEFRRELEELDRSLGEAAFDPLHGGLALQIFDFSQNLVKIWHGSNSSRKREILNCVASNRTLDESTLFEFGPGDCTNFELPGPILEPFIESFQRVPEPELFLVRRLL